MPAVLRPALRCVTGRTPTRVFDLLRSISFCRLRTRFRSPTCDALKILSRKRRTSSSTGRQEIASQSRSPSCSPFTSAISRSVSNLSARAGVAIVVSPKTHLAHVSNPRGSASRRYPASYPSPPPEGERHLPGSVSCCLSAAGISFLGHPVSRPGVRPSSRSAHRTTRSGPGRGFHVPHAQDPAGEGAAYTPGGGVHTAGEVLRSPPAASQRPALHPGRASIYPGLTLTRCHRRFTHVHPSGLPLTCRPRMEQGPLRLLPRGFAPRRYQRRTPGWGRAIEHLPGLRHQRHRRPPTQRATCACDLVSHHPEGAFLSGSIRSQQP